LKAFTAEGTLKNSKIRTTFFQANQSEPIKETPRIQNKEKKG